MWKPGTSKPDNVHMPSTKKQNSAGTSKDSVPPNQSNKKLSNSTMGMRFMQRKNGASKNSDTIQQHTSAARKSHTNHFDRSAASNISTNCRKRENEDTSTDNGQSTSVIILELASVVDMYGVGSDIIGRRSFGGYHKSVHNTWNAALNRRKNDDARARNTKAHITDEELLERYEKYVKGGNSSSRGGGGRKEKRKRHSTRT